MFWVVLYHLRVAKNLVDLVKSSVFLYHLLVAVECHTYRASLGLFSKTGDNGVMIVYIDALHDRQGSLRGHMKQEAGEATYAGNGPARAISIRRESAFSRKAAKDTKKVDSP